MSQRHSRKPAIALDQLRYLAVAEASSPDGLHDRAIREHMLKQTWADLFTKKERAAIALNERLRQTCETLSRQYTLV